MTYIPPRRSDGTIQTRRVPLPWPGDRPFRILSIDGGGICGILPACILSELESRFLQGRSIGRYFDMIAGTSTGGIIALGLAHGLTAAQVRDIYMEKGGLIFPPRGPIRRMVGWLRQTQRYAYERQPLKDELLRIFGDAALAEARNRLCIPAFEGTHGEPWIYKTPHHPDYKRDKFEKMVTVGLATAAAPTFFAALDNNGYTMVDGGLWANNPVMNAVVDALTCFEIDRRQVQVLSLGCGETTFKVDASKTLGGFWQWRKAIKGAMRAQSLNALGQAYLLIGKDQVCRLDAPESSDPIGLDDYLRAKSELPGMARSLVEASGHRVAATFLNDEAVPSGSQKLAAE
ncbi:MAG: patatin-like phospholipase family protein [Rhizobiales bacterium]|nr:patatin-like phospholipase family protein [Hyphomicrobiales bacterium]